MAFSVIDNGLRKMATLEDGRLVTRDMVPAVGAPIRDEVAGGAWRVDFGAPTADDHLPLRWGAD